MEKAKTRNFHHRSGTLELGRRTRLMGIVNVTPDSFSDGGKFIEQDKAIDYALELVNDGADIIDIGAESTRPGSLGVSDHVQLLRLLPVLERIRSNTDTIISIDTRSSVVARACLSAGADMINDVSGLHSDENIAVVCAEFRAGLALMHMRGTPETMQSNVHFDDVVIEVEVSLKESVQRAEQLGVSSEYILVDPGLGFGKSFEHNYKLLCNLNNLQGLGAGVLVGSSRKAFTAEFSGAPASERQYSTAATSAISVLNGADILRVHDVNEMRQVTDICDRYLEVNYEQS